MNRRLTVTQKPDEEIATEILATEIVAISQGIKRLRSGRLNDRALILLIQDAVSGTITRTTVKAVLDGLESLEKQFIKPTARK